MKNNANSHRKTSAPSSPSGHGRGRGPQAASSRSAATSRRAAGGHPSRDSEIPKTWRIVPGFHAIAEALKVRPKLVRQLWIRQGWESSEELKSLYYQVQSLKGKIEVKSPSTLDRLCATHQGAVLMMEGRMEFSLKKIAAHEKSVLLYLDGIEDPHNLGAIIRTSWLVGAHGIYIPEDRAVGLTPTAHKVACGGVEHVPVQEVGNFANHAKELKENGYWIFGLSHKSERTLFDIMIPDKIVWAIGSEDKGLRVTTERLCDELVSIPQISAAASYNASVATAMALTESLRKHTTQHTERKKSQ